MHRQAIRSSSWSSDLEHRQADLGWVHRRAIWSPSPPPPPPPAYSLSLDCGPWHTCTHTFTLRVRLSSSLVSSPPCSPAQALPAQQGSLWLFSFPERNLHPQLRADACCVVLSLVMCITDGSLCLLTWEADPTSLMEEGLKMWGEGLGSAETRQPLQ